MFSKSVWKALISRKHLLLYYFLITFILQSGYCANILFFHHVSTYSHRVQTYPLANALAERHHNVTYISPYHPRGLLVNPKITEIVPERFAKKSEEFFSKDFNINLRVQKLLPRNVFGFYPTGVAACEILLTSPELHAYLETTEKLDLVIMDNCMSDCAHAIIYKYKAKFIIFNTITMIPSEHDTYGVAPESGSIPEMEIDSPPPPMTLPQRAFNFLISMHTRYVHYNYVREIDQLIRKHMGYHDMPFLDDLMRNTSLVLYTGDIVTDYVRSHPPLYVNVGGLYCKPGRPDKLPSELKEFIDKGNGFVFISLGSAVVSSNLPQEIKDVFFDAFESFPEIQFLWKWDGPPPERKPKNLYLDKWFPQLDILAHPKIKAFVTQSGRPSMLESVCNEVPMIAFPVLGDQDANAFRMQQMGGNVVLELGTVTLAQFQNALTKVAFGSEMKERMIELRKILEDRPLPPLDTAIWWTEYVLRHKDTSHLRSSSFNQFWFQRRHLDVCVFLFTIISLMLAFLIFIITKVFKAILKFIRHTSVRSLKDKKTL